MSDRVLLECGDRDSWRWLQPMCPGCRDDGMTYAQHVYVTPDDRVVVDFICLNCDMADFYVEVPR